VQQARLNTATTDLNRAEAQLEDKQKELDLVRAEYDKALKHKQVLTEFYGFSFVISIFYLRIFI